MLSLASGFTGPTKLSNLMGSKGLGSSGDDVACGVDVATGDGGERSTGDVGEGANGDGGEGVSACCSCVDGF